MKMPGIDDAINKEMSSARSRSYLILVLLYLTVDYIHPAQIFLILFTAPPAKAFQYNPHVTNETQTIISEWHFSEEEKNWIPGLLQSIFFLGFMVGTVFFGQLSDRFGRKSVSWKVYTGCMIASLAGGFTRNWQQLVVCRVISGLCIGGLSVVNTIMLQEMCDGKLWVTNGVMTTFSFSIFSCAVLAIAYFLPSWRLVAVATTLPALLGYLFYIFVPESPRWLTSQDRISEAEMVVKKLSRWNGRSRTDYHLLQEENQDPDVKARVQPSASEIKNSIFDLVKHPILRYRTIILIVEWFTTSFVYYCITLGAGSFSPNFYLAFGMSTLGQFPAIPICLYFMDRRWCGRRGTLCGLMLTSSISLFAVYILPESESNAEIRLILSMIAKVGTSGCFTIVYVYTAELYPTVVRNVGLGSMSTFARFGSISAPFVATYTVNTGSAIPFLVYGVLCAFSAVLSLNLPETQGKRIVNSIDEAYEHEEDFIT